MSDRKEIKSVVVVLFFALFVFTRYSFAQQLDHSDDKLASDEVTVTDMVEDDTIVQESGYSKDSLINLKQDDPQKFNEVMKQKRDHFKDLRQSNPERYQKIMEQIRQRKEARLERIKQDNPERYNKIMEQHRARLDHREDVRDRREDVRDKREDVGDRRENVRDHKEDVKDKRDDVRDKREDRRDKHENIRDRKDTPQAPRSHVSPSGGKQAPAKQGKGAGGGRRR